MDPQRPVDRTRSGPGQHQPAYKVVGFRVEGVPPSPSPHTSILNDPSTHQTHVGSPSPVIIPPSFQTESPIRRADEDERRARYLARPSLGVSSGAAPAGLTGLIGQTSNSSGLARQLSGMREADRSTTPLLDMASNLSSTAPSATRLLAQETGAAIEVGPTRSVSDPTTLAVEKTTHQVTGQTRRDADSGGPQSPRSVASSNPTTGLSQQQPLHGQSSQQPQQPATAQAQVRGGGAPTEKAKLTKAERRKIQDEQRAAKAAAKAAKEGGVPPLPKPPAVARHLSTGAPPSRQGSAPMASTQQQASSRSSSFKAQPPSMPKDSKLHVSTQSIELFSHLPAFRQVTVKELLQKAEVSGVHSSIFRLGVDYAEGRIRGSNARCVAMMEAFVDVIQDYITPEGKTLQRDLLNQMNNAIQFLVYCRPLSVTMGNAIKYVKLCITKLDSMQKDGEAKEHLVEAVQSYVENKIFGCGNLLVEKAMEKIDPTGEVVLTYQMSSVVLKILLAAKQAGKQFRVVVLDSRPIQGGQEMTRRLLSAGVSVTYAYISGLSYCMKEATKVFLGASAVLSNGTAISCIGSSMVALMAHAHHVPVMICAETHKFHERVQLDSITNNELGDPNSLVAVPGRLELTGLQGWEKVEKLGILNLMYDAMPAEYIDVICTEFGPLPPSSVPVIIREYREDPYAFA